MGKLKSQSLTKKNNGPLNLKVMVQKFQKSILQANKWAPGNTNFGTRQEKVPGDVKKGHFAVIAADDEEKRRFVVPLEYLNHPLFQRLLERAAEEYGFNHEGALMVPCSPTELEWMLTDRSPGSGGDVGWIWNSRKTIVESY